MKNKKIILLILVITLLIIGGTIYYLNTKEYKYICFNTSIAEGDVISENLLDECITNIKPSKEVITDKNKLIVDTPYAWYKSLKEYNKGEKLHEKDFILYESPKEIATELELLTEVEVMNHGNDEDELIKYKAFVENNKLYAINRKTNEKRLIFDKEKIEGIAVRPFCCAGEGWLLILTTSGNVYISEKDLHYQFSFNFPFKKLEASDIKSFKLIPASDYDVVKNLYGVTSTGKEILLQKLN